MKSQVKLMPQHEWADALVSAYQAALAERELAAPDAAAAGGFYRHEKYFV